MSAVLTFTASRHNRRWQALCIVFCCLTALPDVSATQEAAGHPPEQTVGNISGTVVDQNGNFLLAARVSLTRPGLKEEKTRESDGAGHFVFTAVPPGPFQLTISGERFATQQLPGDLHPGETLEMPPISLAIAGTTSEV